ncbi:MAG TPA: bifunctional serine/threonine-protein kinase/formylglycine-generating enzyme family protein [Verrucomicrobiae bacterium]|nr:bifunctional serine/threonine-protein kinase/formylglycine-generating enzyme family protein [Verrucomicrobiae bacterium]
MSVTQRAFKDLLAGLQQNKLSLVDVIQSLNARGQVQSPLHRAELSMLDEALAGGKLDEKMHRLLTAKLKDLQIAKVTVEKTSQQAAYKPVVGNDDKTQMGGGDQTALNPSGQDRTTINPAGDNGDATVINADGSAGDSFDLLMGQSDGDATEMGGAETTGFKPAEPATKSKTGTGGPSTSSWQRVATAGGPQREVHAGDTLKDRFYLDKEVGRGGMGIVFKARDERKVEAQDKNPWVAVKVLNPEFRKHPQALVALQRESRKAQQLTHDNILRVFDFDKDQTVIYMTMEYVDGGSLKDVIKKHPTGMPFDKGWPIIQGLARGLGRAHRDNIVHSDFKPGNVMMTTDGIPKLFDMGIARAAQAGGESKGETTVFDAGELGALTPAYASLEMIQGQPPQLIDDIYALGITAYEILVGKHPFGKKNAEQAMKEGMRPPIVPGLSRKQQKTLQQSVAFKREQRLKTCDELLEGMRPRTLKDSALPIMGGVFAVFVMAVLVFAVLLPQLKARRIDAVGQQFVAKTFADHAAALAAIEAMDDGEAEAAKQKYSKDIQNYFFDIANSKWDLAAKPPKYDNPGALAVIGTAKALYPDSAAVSDNLRRLDEQKKKALSELNDAFNDHVDANRIYEDKTPNIVETVSIVRQIDPDHELLKDTKLLGRYTTDVRNALEAGQFELAERRAATSIKVFPTDKDLLALQSGVRQGREMQLAAVKERELREKMTAADAKAKLTKLAANPLFTPDWQVNVNVAMSKLTGDNTPETMQLKTQLADAFAKQLASKVDAKDLVAGQMVADASGKLFGGLMPNLSKEMTRFNEARKVQQAQEVAKAALAEGDTLKRTVRTKAEANDVRGAQAALDRLRALVPTDPYLSGDGPKALGEAYLRQANKQAEQGRYDTAQQFVAAGLKVAPGLQALKDAEKGFRVEANAALLQAGASQPANANGDKLKVALDALRNDDSARHARLSSELPSTVLSRLQTLTNTDPAAAAKGKAEWLKVFPQNSRLAALVIPTGVAAPATSTASTAPSASLPSEARKARRAAGQDTCQASYAGFGRSSKASCADDVAGAAGPKLIVVPGLGGGSPFAITKYEVTVDQFDAFCAATGKCKSAGGNGALPRTNVTLAQAKAFAAWLSETTGFTYRLPTDAEWVHAVDAGGKGAGDAGNFNCVVMSGGSQIKGGIAVPATTGAANAWGLVNGVGNAAEWVEGGSARGGHFNVPTTQCTVDWRQSGTDNDTIGLRLVREMG